MTEENTCKFKDRIFISRNAEKEKVFKKNFCNLRIFSNLPGKKNTNWQLLRLYIFRSKQFILMSFRTNEAHSELQRMLLDYILEN